MKTNLLMCLILFQGIPSVVFMAMASSPVTSILTPKQLINITF